MRIRSIKPEFWSHPIMGRLESEARLLALALLNYADDSGYFLADPLLVRGACCPFVDDSSKVRRWLVKLTEAGWIELSAETPHGQIGRVVNFEEHQRIDRPKPSKIKEYWIDDESTTNRRLIDDASSLEQGAGSREQGRDRRRRNGAAAPFQPPTPTDVDAYMDSIDRPIDGEAFCDYWQSVGWKRGNKPMIDWQSSARNWHRRMRPEEHAAIASRRAAARSRAEIAEDERRRRAEESRRPVILAMVEAPTDEMNRRADELAEEPSFSKLSRRMLLQMAATEITQRGEA